MLQQIDSDWQIFGKTWLLRGAEQVLAIATVVTMSAGVAIGQTAPDGGKAAAPRAIQVYGCDIHDITDSDTGAAPVLNLVGARNGAYSAKVVVRSGEHSIQGLQAAAGDLRQGANTIPATAIQVRFGTAWDTDRANSPKGNDVLLESPLPEFPAGRVTIWATVRIPKAAPPGTYTGQMKLQARGLPEPVQVPVKLDVRPYTLPDPQQYRTWIETVKSPDTLAVEYDVPLWSEQHWAMVAKTMKLVAGTGDRMIYIPLIAHTNYGNSESMVRWIKKPDGKFDYDFSIFEKYLDTVEKNLGTPKVIMLHAWEQYMAKPSGAEAPVEVKGAEGSYEWREAMSRNARLPGLGPKVTVVDPTTGKVDIAELPRYEDPKARELWQPVWDGVRQRLAKRGWDKYMMVGNMVDIWPTKLEVQTLSELSGGIPWTCCAHHLPIMVPGKSLGKLHGVTEVGCADVALDEVYNLNPDKGERLYGWKLSPLYAHYFRFQVFNTATYSALHILAERMISGNKRGIGHIGADSWPCLKDKQGRRRGTVTDRYPESYWHSLNVQGWLLAPGPQGPVGTARLELFREGIQECEARISIEQALTDEPSKTRLGEDLAKRAQNYLDQRQVTLWKAVGVTDADIEKYGVIKEYRTWLNEVAKRADEKAGVKWYLASGWQERNAKLYDLADEIARKLGRE